MSKSILLIVVIMMIAISCTVRSKTVEPTDYKAYYTQYYRITNSMYDSLMAELQKCIDPNPTDWQCDSCWKVIFEGTEYGLKVNPVYWHDHGK